MVWVFEHGNSSFSNKKSEGGGVFFGTSVSLSDLPQIIHCFVDLIDILESFPEICHELFKGVEVDAVVGHD